MIFDGRSLDVVTDSEIKRLVDQHLSERQHLEFKLEWDHRSDASRLEILKDVASLANGGGGYLFVGIRDDGRGRAQRLEGITGDIARRCAQALSGLCQDHIADRIVGLEIRVREVDGHSILAVRVPATERTPHMVTLQHQTHFAIRNEDGKREMSLNEIRSAFLDDPTTRRLSRIESVLEDMRRSESIAEQTRILDAAGQTSRRRLPPQVTDGTLAVKHYQKQFQNEVGASPFLWIAAMPTVVAARRFDVRDDSLVQVFKNAPGSRESGWSMASPRHFTPEIRSSAIEAGRKSFEYLVLRDNLCLEFWTPLDQHFCWRQSPEEFERSPRLYPYAVVEYPTSFLRFYRAILDVSQSMNLHCVVLMEYRNLKGYSLWPGRPDSIMYNISMGERPLFENQHLEVGPHQLPSEFSADEEAFALVEEVYDAFGLGRDKIPFYDPSEGFTFGS